ncbi:MAG: cobalt/nickel transport protein [Actinomycetota bacterium]|nr:cobalt/nickel transport protein [Actinomycetota bacterium]
MTARRIKLPLFVGAGLAVALLLAFLVSPHASSQPDGLNKVAVDHGFADQQKPQALGDGPLAGYGVKGVDDNRLSTGLAGIIGVTATFALGLGFFALVRRTRRTQASPPTTAGTPT